MNDFSHTQESELSLSRLVAESAAAIGVNLDRRQITLFQDYLNTICIWNEKINLVSTKSSLDIPIKHFIDSLIPHRFILDHTGRLLDIGTGAGFPGIPLKIAFPSLRVTLLESSRKRSSFLKHVIRTLQLKTTTVWNGRVETYLEKGLYQGIFDVVISRAAFKLPELVSFAGYFLADRGVLIAMKGPDVSEELADAEQARISADLNTPICHDVHLPVTDEPRKLLIYKKRN
jgi:16S rRNA (guanine527-N7)-methyltransferase